MARIPAILVVFLVVIILTVTQYSIILFSGSVSVQQHGNLHQDSRQTLLELKLNKTLHDFMNDHQTKHQTQKNDLVEILEKLKVIESNIESKSDNPLNATSPLLQDKLSVLDDRIRKHEQESLNKLELDDMKEQLSSVERYVLTNHKDKNHSEQLENAFSSLEQSLQRHDGSSATRNDIQHLWERVSTLEQYVQGITNAHIQSLGRPFDSEPFFGLNNQTFCVPWQNNMDEWWTHHVDWYASKENETHQCFSKMEDPEKATFFRTLYDIQWKGNCSNVFTKEMWSAGWGADVRNMIDGLQQAMKAKQPMQMYTKQPWHYAHATNRSTCDTKDYRCYFLDLGKCQPNRESYTSALLNQKLRMDKTPGSWYYEYATRQQTWVRQKVLRFSSKVNIQTPCTVAHVRRGDIVLHRNRVRRYHEIDDYVERMDNDTENIFLLTDDANAISEALYKFPKYNWIYINRPRHRGSEGGFENQIPSGNPKFEVIVLLSIFRLVKKCSTLVHTKSGFALLLKREMEEGGLKTINVDMGRPLYSNDYALTENISKAYPIAQ